MYNYDCSKETYLALFGNSVHPMCSGYLKGLPLLLKAGGKSMTPVLNSLCFNGTGSIIFTKRDTIHPNHIAVYFQEHAAQISFPDWCFFDVYGYRCVKILLQGFCA